MEIMLLDEAVRRVIVTVGDVLKGKPDDYVNNELKEKYYVVSTELTGWEMEQNLQLSVFSIPLLILIYILIPE